MSTILHLKNLSVSFKGFKAIDNVDMSVEKGELRVIIGPNGAGKSTLMDLITGKTKPSAGCIMFNGTDITNKRSYDISGRHSIGRKFQGPNLFDNMTVYENIEVALKGHATVIKTFIYRKTPEISENIDTILKQINLYEKKHLMAASLSHGERQWLEMGMVMAQNPELIILDEPTAGMTAEETYKTGEMIKTLLGKHTVIVVEHDMDFVRQVARRVTVLHQGRVLAEGPFKEIENDPRVIQVYLKTDMEEAGI